MNCKRRDGYSLVEVCLALLVAGIGIMVVFGLFPEGLGQSRKSVEATEIATFADYVFAGLTARVVAPNAWINWNNFETGQLNLTESLEKITEPQPFIDLNQGFQKFWWLPQYYGDKKSAYIANYKVASFTYSLLIQNVIAMPNMKGARLEVWPGDIPTPPAMPGKVFYREFTPIR